MAGDVITTDRAKKTLDTLLQRRDRFHAGGEHRQQEDDALQRLAAASAAIDDVWAQGAQRVEELQREAERVRDEVRARTAALEVEHATALLELADMWSVTELALLLGSSPDQVRELISDAREQLAGVPSQRDH